MSDEIEADVFLSRADGAEHYRNELVTTLKAVDRLEKKVADLEYWQRVNREKLEEQRLKIDHYKTVVGKAIGCLHVIEAHASSFARFWRNHRSQPEAVDKEVQIIRDRRRQAHQHLTEVMKLEEADARLAGTYQVPKRKKPE